MPLEASGGSGRGWLGGALGLVLCLVRYALCLVWVAFISVVYLPAFLVLLPRPLSRVYLANRWANAVGRMMLRLLAVRLEVEGLEHLERRGEALPPASTCPITPAAWT